MTAFVISRLILPDECHAVIPDESSTNAANSNDRDGPQDEGTKFEEGSNSPLYPNQLHLLKRIYQVLNLVLLFFR